MTVTADFRRVATNQPLLNTELSHHLLLLVRISVGRSVGGRSTAGVVIGAAVGVGVVVRSTGVGVMISIAAWLAASVIAVALWCG